MIPAGPRLKAAAPLLLYGSVTLLLAYPLLTEGYVFALDHAFGPRASDHYAGYLAANTDPLHSKAGYALLLLALDTILPPEAAQKLLLFLPFALAGLGMHRLALAGTPAARALGGLVYMLSPFAYLRAVVGQTGVLWAYALAPWFLHHWWQYRETGSRRAFVASALLLTLTAMFQAHGAVLLGALVLVDTLVRLPRDRTAWRPAVTLAGASLTLNAYWVLPVLLAPETTLTHLGHTDRTFFMPQTATFPSVGLAALTLQGFWRAGPTPYYATPGLLLIPLGIVLLSVRGALDRWADPRVRTLVIAGLAGFWLAVGAASPATAPAFDAAWRHVPLFQGFRDSHKLLALLALAYGALAPAGATALLAHLRRTPLPRAVPTGALALLLAAPVLAAAPLLHGFDGQLGTTPYPAEWEAADAATANCDGRLLVLPWHLYLDLGWVPNADPRVVNPAKLFFTCPTLAGDNVEAGAVRTQSARPESRYVEHLLHDSGLAHGNPEGIRDLGHRLAPLDVQYILLLKEADWRTLDATLAAQGDLEPILDNARLRVYENRAHGSGAPPPPDAPPLPTDPAVAPAATFAGYGISAVALGLAAYAATPGHSRTPNRGVRS